MYADAFGLLVFGAPLTSVSLSKNKFFDRLTWVCQKGTPIYFGIVIVRTIWRSVSVRSEIAGIPDC